MVVRAKKQKKNNSCLCPNCKYSIPINPTTVKETRLGELIATYIECPVCGEKVLKQLDTESTLTMAQRGIKIQSLLNKGVRMSKSQKQRLKDIEKRLFSIRLHLKKRFWDEMYQSLNQEEDEKTGKADQELKPGK